MMKQEFEKMVGAELSAADYEIVEVVYMHYSEKVNKDTVAAMYAAAGMMIFRDLYPRAKRIHDLTVERERLAREMDFIKKGGEF